MKSSSSSIFTILILLFWVTSCGNNSLNFKNLKPLKQDEYIQVYFNQNLAKNAEYTDPYRNIKRPGDNLEKIIIDAINSSETSIDVAVQELRLPQIAEALVNRYQQGIKIRVILENQYNKSFRELTQNNYEEINERTQTRYQELATLLDINKDGQITDSEILQKDAIIILRNAQIPLIDDTEDASKGSGLMHHKFIIIDNQKVLTGSPNFTLSDIHGDLLAPETRGNANNLLQMNSPKIAQIFTEEFNLMWGDGGGKKTDSLFGNKKPLRKPVTVALNNSQVTIQFSPFSRNIPWNFTSNGLIDRTLNKAQQSVNLALFVFTEQKLVDTLKIRHSFGAEIRALIDPSFAYRSYSEGLDMLGVSLSNKCQYEQDNNPWTNPIQTMGIPSLPQGDLLHHKFAVIDEKIVITGSHNWSDAANYTNDETVLIIENPMIAVHYQREFNNLYAKAILGLPVSIQERIKEDKNNCQNFKINNNTPKIINLNTATKSELETLPGIGPTLAQRIIDARQEKPFISLEDFDKRVSGIGPSSVQNLRGKVRW